MIFQDLLIFENKINVMMKYSLIDFTDIFDDIDKKINTTIIKSIFNEIEIFSSSKAIISMILMI